MGAGGEKNMSEKGGKTTQFENSQIISVLVIEAQLESATSARLEGGDTFFF